MNHLQENMLTPLFPLHTRLSPVTPLFPLDTKNRGVGALIALRIAPCYAPLVCGADPNTASRSFLNS